MKKILSILLLFLVVFSKSKAQNYQQLKAEVAKQMTIDVEKAMFYARLATNQASSEFGEKSRQYAESLNSLGELHKSRGNMTEAEKYLLKSQTYFKDSLYNTEENGINLMSLGKFYHQTNQYEKAYFWFNKYILFSTATNNECKGAFAYVGDFFNDMGDYKKARYYLEKNIDQCEILVEKAPLEYAYRIEHLANFYANTGDYLATEQLYQRCFPIFKKYIPSTHPEWAYVQSNYLNFLIRLKNFKKANTVINELFTIPYTKSSVEIMQRIAFAYWQMKNLKEAETFYNFCINLSATQSPDNKCNDPKLFAEIGALNIELNELEKADDYLQTAEKILTKNDIPNKIKIKKASETDKALYINVLSQLGTLANAQHDYSKAITYFKKAWKVVETQNKVDEERKREIISQLIIANEAIDDYASLEKMLELDIHQGIVSQTNKILPVVGSRLRVQYLEENEKYNHILTSVLTRSSKKIKNSGALMYDFCLATKSIALQWNLDELTKTRRSKDSSIIIAYKNWQNIKNQIHISDQKSEINEHLNNLLEENEAKLIQKLSLNNDYFKSPDWHQVQAKLNPNELAIEFLVVPYYNPAEKKYSGDTLYFANLLGYESITPDLVYLFEQKELSALLDNGDDLYGDSKAYELIWKKIAPFTNNIKKIYSSPAGLLHQITLPALLSAENKRLIDKFQIQRVMSTRNIVTQKEEEDILKKGETLIFAGMDYDNYSDESNFIATHYTSDPNTTQDTSFNDNERGNDFFKYKDLFFTQVEGEKIFQINSETEIPTRFFTGKYASEKNIKWCSQQKTSPNVLIISTHGFYFPQDTSKENIFSWNTEPLMRCGLVMSGANLYDGKLNNKTTNNEGIWRGYEIEQSNLSNTQLVVLSACESGNGEISNTEGVFGLQRAFKLAGANYILMCLNKIHDQKASEFVTYFYEKIAKGTKIPIAFYETQLFFKNKYPNTLEWSNWVLLF